VLVPKRDTLIAYPSHEVAWVALGDWYLGYALLKEVAERGHDLRLGYQYPVGMELGCSKVYGQ
jgi:hypothetical protein